MSRVIYDIRLNDGDIISDGDGGYGDQMISDDGDENEVDDGAFGGFGQMVISSYKFSN